MTAADRADYDRASAYKANGHAHPDRTMLDTIWADDIELNLHEEQLMEGLLPRTGIGVLYAESGAGKTFVAIDLACHVATGRAWRGRDVTQGPVIYVAAENPASVKRRLWAWKQYHGADRLPVLVVQSGVDLLNGAAQELAELVLTTLDVETQLGVRMVVIDTLARAMTGNENAPDDMGRFVAGCGMIREASEALVLVVHHSGKDTAKGARGHSSLRAATDVELEIAASTLRVTKSRDDATGDAFGFRLHTVDLGSTAKGHNVTTCVAVEAEIAEPLKKPRRLGANEKVVFDALTAAIVDRPDPTPTGRDVPATARGVRTERWMEYALRYLPQPEEKRKREAFARAIASLVADSLVRHVDGFAWLP